MNISQIKNPPSLEEARDLYAKLYAFEYWRRIRNMSVVDVAREKHKAEEIVEEYLFREGVTHEY